MGIIKNIKIKIIVMVTILITIFFISVNSYAAKYTTQLSKNDKLKFTGNAWSVYKTQAIAESLGNGKHPKVKRYLKKGETFQILEVKGNVLKIKNNEYIYYGSTAAKYFKKINEKIAIDELQTEKEIYEVKEGKTIKIKVIVTPSNASKKDELNWSSSNPEIATVDQNGTVTAKAVGETAIYIQATDGSNEATKCKVIVTQREKDKISGNKSEIKAVKVKIIPTSTKLAIGQTTRLIAEVIPNNVTNKEIKWTSSNSSVIKVLNARKGIIKGMGVGKADITATAQDGSRKKAIVTIEVENLIKCNHPIDQRAYRCLKIEKDVTYHQKKIKCRECSNILKIEKEKHNFGLISSVRLNDGSYKNKYKCKGLGCQAIKIEICKNNKIIKQDLE